MTATKSSTKVQRRAARFAHLVQIAPTPEAALAAAYDGLRSAASAAKKRGHHGAVQTVLGASPRTEYGALGGDVDGVLGRVTEWLVQAAVELDEMTVP